MAKRFTDTEKWRDEWWGSLSNDYRMIWLYLVDSCSIAGIWKKDFRGLRFNCNVDITEEEFREIFGERLIDTGNVYFIPKFLRFQYPKGLNSKKPAIISVIKELQLNNLITTVNELFGNDYLIIKDKDTDKDKDKVKDKVKDKNSIEEKIKSVFDDVYIDHLKATFTKLNMENEMEIFKLRVRGSPGVYGNRDTDGLRQAFLYQLNQSKNGNNRKQDKKTIRGNDAIIEKKDWGEF